ncbi:NINE protein [Brevundimonas sp. SL130]|uniref:NINE protein n=1 Tax=Brevundimonas sp. SL130 TaxID=2995143 RepID=UPI00226D3070|nr:NINE protein [Brevundimonas sp. SL130]WAC60255.1 NINE protein [Brevundimonas sp. SL130]
MSNQGGLSADTQALMAFESSKKSTGIAYLLWFFTGGFGGHRFYLGRTGSAVGQLCLCIVGILTAVLVIGFFLLAALGVWLLVDLFTIGGMVEDHNRNLMNRLNVGTKSQESTVDELAKFAALRDSGAISEDEYDVQKRRLIGSPPVGSQSTAAES